MDTLGVDYILALLKSLKYPKSQLFPSNSSFHSICPCLHFHFPHFYSLHSYPLAMLPLTAFSSLHTSLAGTNVWESQVCSPKQSPTIAQACPGSALISVTTGK